MIVYYILSLTCILSFCFINVILVNLFHFLVINSFILILNLFYIILYYCFLVISYILKSYIFFTIFPLKLLIFFSYLYIEYIFLNFGDQLLNFFEFFLNNYISTIEFWFFKMIKYYEEEIVYYYDYLHFFPFLPFFTNEEFEQQVTEAYDGFLKKFGIDKEKKFLLYSLLLVKNNLEVMDYLIYNNIYVDDDAFFEDMETYLHLLDNTNLAVINILYSLWFPLILKIFIFLYFFNRFIIVQDYLLVYIYQDYFLVNILGYRKFVAFIQNYSLSVSNNKFIIFFSITLVNFISICLKYFIEYLRLIFNKNSFVFLIFFIRLIWINVDFSFLGFYFLYFYPTFFTVIYLYCCMHVFVFDFNIVSTRDPEVYDSEIEFMCLFL